MNKSNFQMIDVGEKAVSHRIAVAQGVISMEHASFSALAANNVPKGNVLALAEVAGIMAAKRACQELPLCHTIALDAVQFSFELNEKDYSVLVQCEASAHAKTGVEMEALAGVTGALLAMYDLLKSVSPVLTISDIRLNTKRGGKSGYWEHPQRSATDGSNRATQQEPSLIGVVASVLTISDSVARGTREDKSGTILCEFLRTEGATVANHQVVADDKPEIVALLRAQVTKEKVALIITSGGTGIGPRDNTPEAMAEVLDKSVPGIAEELRRIGMKHITSACLSRLLCGLIDKTLVIALPGSSKAIIESLPFLKAVIPHAMYMIRGGGHAG